MFNIIPKIRGVMLGAGIALIFATLLCGPMGGAHSGDFMQHGICDSSFFVMNNFLSRDNVLLLAIFLFSLITVSFLKDPVEDNSYGLSQMRLGYIYSRFLPSSHLLEVFRKGILHGKIYNYSYL